MKTNKSNSNCCNHLQLQIGNFSYFALIALLNGCSILSGISTLMERSDKDKNEPICRERNKACAESEKCKNEAQGEDVCKELKYECVSLRQSCAKIVYEK